VAVRTVCQGVRVDFDTHSPTSRWRFVRGLPLVFDEPTRLPVGCLTISSTKVSDESVLNRLPNKARAEFHRGFVASLKEVLGVIPETLG
jgi:hypothetical protein